MKRTLRYLASWFCIAGCLLALCDVGRAQAPRKIVNPKTGQTHWTGRKPLPPEALKRLADAAKQRHGNLIARLPKATAAVYDARVTGVIPPIRDQGQCGSCFTGDTMIRMADGTYRRIDKIRVGDLVVSAEGNVCPVTHVMQRQFDGRLAKIVVSGHYQLEATPEHPILTEDGYRPISNVQVGQFVAIPRYLAGGSHSAPIDGRLSRLALDDSPSFPFAIGKTDRSPDELPLTFKTGRLLGLYVAEGTAGDRKLVWSFSIKEAETFAAEVAELCQTELNLEAAIDLIPDRGGCKVRVHSARLERQFAAWFGSGPENKSIPACFMTSNPEFLRGLLSGWMDGDRQRGDSAVTTSYVMAMQMHDIANYLGMMPSLLVHTEPKVDSRGIAHLRSWRVALNNPETYKRGAAKMTDTHLWRKVTSAGPSGTCYSGLVYNLEVEGDHSYVANGIGVHNCWDFSGSGMCTVAFIKAGQIPNSTNGCSEQYTLDCGQNGGCNGDDNVTVLQWCKATGLPLDKDYGVTYQASSGRCASTSAMKLYKISDYGFCTNGGNGVANVQDIKNAIVAYGCVGCGVAAGGGWWNSGTGTDTANGQDIDHDVILVAWDDTHDNGDGSKGAWIMRNSWGTSWGDKCANTANPNPVEAGYGWMKYGADSIGTEAVWAVAASVKPPNPWVFGKRASLETRPGDVACCGYQIEAKSHCGCYATPDFCTCTSGKCQCYGGTDCHLAPNRATAPATYNATFTTTSNRQPGNFGSDLFGISANLPQFLPAGTYSAVLTPVGQQKAKSTGVAVLTIESDGGFPVTSYNVSDYGGKHTGILSMASAPLAKGSYAVTFEPIYPTIGKQKPRNSESQGLAGNGIPSAICDTTATYRDPQTGRRWRHTTPQGDWEWLPEPQTIQPLPQVPALAPWVPFGGGFRMTGGGGLLTLEEWPRVG